MTDLMFLAVGGLMLASCSQAATESLPPLATIQSATLEYANCVDQAARTMARRSSPVEDAAQQAVATCSELRSAALKLKGVPVVFPTVAEFDEVHLGLARQTAKDSREKKL